MPCRLLELNMYIFSILTRFYGVMSINNSSMPHSSQAILAEGSASSHVCVGDGVRASPNIPGVLGRYHIRLP